LKLAVELDGGQHNFLIIVFYMFNHYRKENHKAKPILVTGSPRSGTTWVGHMLSAAPEVYYIHEPFNPSINLHKYGLPRLFERYFTYITEGNESYYYSAIKCLIGGKYKLRYGIADARSLGDLQRTLKQYREFRRRRKTSLVPLIKDPIALLSADWLCRRFDINVLVMIRHPAAVISSMKRLGWGTFPDRWALPQYRLMNELLAPFEEQLKQLEKKECDLIEHNAVQWKMLHHVISYYKKEHRDWVFLRHMDISCDPMTCFTELFNTFGLTLTEFARNNIEEYSSRSNPAQAYGTEKPFQLNSEATISNWKHKLSPSEIQRIRELVEDVSCEFYSDDDWL
jgi:hypothetical protein